MNHKDIDLYRKHSSVEGRKDFLKQFVPDIDSYDEDLFIREHNASFCDLEDEQIFELGNVDVVVYAAPGHTKGMMVFLVKQDRTIVFGDACGVFTLFCMPEATSLEEYVATLDKLKGLMPQYDRILRQHGTCESPLSLVDEDIDIDINPADLRIDVYRASGAGGQHINKTSSAIRVTHIPTGTVVECQNERSQFQNKDKALEILRSRLLAQKQKEQQDAINAQRQGQVGTGDRSEKIRTYNFPQDRCTDHRIGLTVHNLEKIMDGNLDEVIDALATREQTEKLQRLGG